MNLRAHGEYQIETHGHVVEVTTSGSWNAEGMASFIENFKAESAKLAGQPWAALVDLTQWTLATPETEAQMDRLQEWCLAHNQVYEALVMSDSALVEAQMDRYSEVLAGKLEQRYFSDRDEAREWLTSLGMYD
jgi:hypothetical protein